MKIRSDWKPPQTLPKTESEMIKFVWDQSDIPQELREKVKVYFIVAPMQKISGTQNFRRPNTDASIKSWLEEHTPQPGTYLLVSNSQYMMRQALIARILLPEYCELEIVGDKASDCVSVGEFLDELARWIYQVKISFETKKQEV